MAELLQYPFVTYDQEADRSEYTEEVVFHQIAEKTGYYNSLAMIRVFKRYEGETPGKYREKLTP